MTKGLIASGRPASSTSSVSILIQDYANYLHQVRGFAVSTVSYHRYTAECFLQHLDEVRIALKDMQVCHIESYVTKTGKRLSRSSLQHDIGALRGFLRFLGSNGKAPHALASQIDTPRVYLLQQFPPPLPRVTSRPFLRSICTPPATGVRAY